MVLRERIALEEEGERRNNESRNDSKNDINEPGSIPETRSWNPRLESSVTSSLWKWIRTTF